MDPSVHLVLGLTLLLLIVFPTSSVAQGFGAVEGFVSDQSESPIQGATVSIPEENRSTTTDSSGYYRIGRVPGGQKTLRATASGFQAEERTVEVVSDETIQESFLLEPATSGLTLSPATLDFGTVTVGDSSTMTVTIENTGSEDVEIQAIQIEGPDTTDFEIPGDPLLGVLAPEETQSVDVRFEPQTEGPKDADFVVESSAGRRLVDLIGEGEGVSPTAVTRSATDVTARQATLRGLVDPGGAETTVEFEVFPTGQPDQAQFVPAVESPLTGSGEQSVTATADSLTPGTEYTVRVRAENSAGSDTGADQSFTTQALPPEATVAAPTDVSDSSATLRGSVNPGGAATTVEFEYFPSGQPDQGQTVAAEQSPLEGMEDQEVSATIGGLTPGIEYVFRVRAENSAGTDTSADQAFATDAVPPTAVTEAPTNIMATSAQFNGRVNPGGAATTVEFEYFPSGQPDQVQTVAAEQSPLTGNSEQDVSATVDGLTPGADYTVRVRAENSAGSDVGADQSFTAEAGPPIATTQDATEVTTSSAVLNGSVDPNGQETTVTFEYFPTAQSENRQTVAADQSPLSGTGEQNVSASIEGLVPRTQYTMRVHAENSTGSDTGDDVFFTTDAAPPEAVTEAPSNVTVTSARFNGSIDPNNASTEVRFEYFPSNDPDQVQSITASESPLTGRGAQDVSATVEDLTPGTEYTVRVVATSEGGTTRGDPRTLTTASPEVTVERSVQVPERGSALDVLVTVAEGFQPTETQLFYRQSGASDYQTLSLSEAGSSTFEGTIPGTAVTERGLEFYVRLSEGDVTATAPETDPASQPIFVPVRVSELGAQVQLQPEQYAMISVPLVLDDPGASAVLEDDFGAIDRTQWRLLRWNSSTGEYEEFTAANGSNMALEPGRAFWLIARDGGTFDVENAQSVRAEPVSLTLPPGLTQIANPRAYPIAWSEVDGGEQVSAPIAFDPNATSEDPYEFNVSVLDPWSGYWVFNPGSTPVEITFPSEEAQGAAVSNRTSSKTKALLFGTEPTYALQLKATLDRAGSASATKKLYDTHNVVGLAKGASPGVALDDVAEPPPIGNHVHLSIVEEKTRLAGSLRPTGKEGYSWNLEISAEVSDAPARQTVRVRLREYGAAPSGFERLLIDRDTGQRISLSNNTFDLTLTDDRPTRRLRLVLGTEDFTATESRSVRPEQTVLRAVYPNPSQGPVSVDFQLENAQHVHIAVYDMLGRRMHTLVDERRPVGHHTVRWDGSLDSGEPAASGMYLLRMKSETVTSTRRVVLVR